MSHVIVEEAVRGRAPRPEAAVGRPPRRRRRRRLLLTAVLSAALLVGVALPLEPSLAPPPVQEWLSGATVVLEVGDDLQAVVDAHPAGTHYRIAAGVHHLASITPKDGDRFTGEPGAVLSGAKVLDGFTRDDAGRWTIGGQTQEAPTSGNYGSTRYDAGNDHYADPGSEQEVFRGEELFLNGVRARHVNSLDEVDRPGTWYLDADADTITLYDDPAGTLVETSVLPAAFLGDGTADVTIEHLTVRHYASPANRGAIAGRGSTGWTVRAVEARSNHGVGIDIGPGMTLTASRMTDNGQLSLGGRGDLPERAPITIAGNEIDSNATLGYQIGWGAGGSKLVLTTGLLFEHNWIHDNAGKGAWFDIDNRDGTVRSNLVERNGTVGIFWEISDSARIY